MPQLEIFISIAPDLEEEREALGRAITELPVSLGWTVKFTSRSGEALPSVRERVSSSHFYLFVLGQDIHAPMGVEWDLARRSGKRILAFRKDLLATPATRAFEATAGGMDWQSFHQPEELAQLVQKVLARELRDGAEHYGISPEEWLKLGEFLRRLDRSNQEDDKRKEPRKLRGAGEGGIILPSEERKQSN